jgi:hypothetical protein
MPEGRVVPTITKTVLRRNDVSRRPEAISASRRDIYAMSIELKSHNGTVKCPFRGRTSVAVCRSCPEFKRMDGSHVVCDAGVNTLGDWQGSVGHVNAAA